MDDVKNEDTQDIPEYSPVSDDDITNMDDDSKSILKEEGHPQFQGETPISASEVGKKEDTPPAKPKEEEGKPADKPEEGKPKEGEEEGKPVEKKEDKPEIKRDVTMVPAWKLKTAESQAKVRETDLLNEIETLKKKDESDGKTPEDGKPSDADKASAEDLVEKHNISPELAEYLVSINKKGADISPEIKEKLAELDVIKGERVKEQATTAFNSEFKEVLPLVKEEYPDIPEDKVSELQERLKELAHSEEYHQVPVEEIFRGRAEFREFFVPAKPSGEGSRGGTQGGKEEVDFSNVTEKDIDKMDRDTFEKYSEHMAQQERGDN